MKKHSIKGGAMEVKGGINTKTSISRSESTGASNTGGKAVESYGALKGAGSKIAAKGTLNSRVSVTKPGGTNPIGHAQPLRTSRAVTEPRGTDNPIGGKRAYRVSKPQK